MQRTVFLFITKYEDDTVEMYQEGTEIQSQYFWRTTDELNVNRSIKITFPVCGQPTSV